MKFNLLFLIFLFSYLANGVTINSSSQFNDQAAGIIIQFHKWPDKEEMNLLVKHLGNKGLVKGLKIDSLKMYSFKWSEVGKVAEAKKLCTELSKLSGISSIKYCEPDSIVQATAKKKPVNVKNKVVKNIEKVRHQPVKRQPVHPPAQPVERQGEEEGSVQ